MKALLTKLRDIIMAKKEKSIKVNFIYNIFYQILMVCTPLITSPIVSRNLGANQIGVYSYTYSIAYYFLLFGMLGVKNYGNRSIARARDDKEELSREFWSIYLFQILSSFVMLFAYVFYLVVLCEQNALIAFVQVFLVISGVFDISWFFFGLEMFKVTTIRSTIIKLLNVVCIVLFVRQPSDLWKYTLIMAGGTLLSQLIMWPFLKTLVYFRKPKIKEVLSHFKPNLVLFIPVIATNLFKYMDKIMLGNMAIMTELGYYENAERLVQIPNTLVTALGTVMLPRMSNLVKNGNKKESDQLIYKSMLISVFACSAMAFGIVGVSDVFVPLFFGEEFIPVTSLLYLLVPTMIFICWGDVIRTQFLIPNMKDVSYLVSVAVACIVNLVINYMLIPTLGASGAAVGTICAEFLVCFLQTVFVCKDLPVGKYFKNCIVFILFGLVMYATIFKINIGGNFLSVVVRIAVGGTVYLVLSIGYLYLCQRSVLLTVLPDKLKKIIKK